MKKIDAHLHLAQIVAGYCRRGELRAIGDGKAQWGNGEIFQLFPPEYGDTNLPQNVLLRSWMSMTWNGRCLCMEACTAFRTVIIMKS